MILSLCTGIGGLDRAVELVTGDSVGAYAETDPAACRVLERLYPGVPNLGDIKSVDWSQVGPVDVLVAGYPCQPFSSAGKRKGGDDPRHLWPAVAVALRVLRPRLVFLENVSGHLSLGFDAVLCDLAAIGFDAEWGCLPASAVGACHRRNRLFILAYDPDADRWRREECPQRDGDSSPTPSHWHPRWHHADGLGLSDHAGVTLLPTPSAGQHNYGEAPESWLQRREVLKAKGINGNGAGLPLGIAVRLLPTPRARDGKGASAYGDGGPDLPTALSDDALWDKYAPAITRHEAVFGEPAPAPLVGGSPSPRFVAWMMGVPWSTFEGLALSRSAVLRMLGNACVTRQAETAFTLLAARVDRDSIGGDRMTKMLAQDPGDKVGTLVLAGFALAFLAASAFEPAGKLRGVCILIALGLACLAAVDWMVTHERPKRPAPPAGLGHARETHCVTVPSWDELPGVWSEHPDESVPGVAELTGVWADRPVVEPHLVLEDNKDLMVPLGPDQIVLVRTGVREPSPFLDAESEGWR